ncbi:MAG TPA: SpaA isopeptide-forming pilin-related protein [Candidatus Limnocylindrales bacterium]|nr:SpaA isopeptide-forming pilin-related protein [Candidatus Limnocylindrales bacterium]
MVPLRSDLIGASMWYEAFIGRNGGFEVNITAGSGDCMAGCINQRTWHYAVDSEGTVTLESEEGDEVELSAPTPSEDPSNVQILLNAGPVCPVEQIPADPDCAARAVANATVTLYAADGTEVAMATTGANGMVAFEVPAGAYYVVAQQVEGYMGTPDAQAFSTVGGDAVGLVMSYDTGIR